MQVTAADYILKAGVSNFRNAWESLDSELERVDEYSLGTRENLQDAVQAVTTILGMQICEVSVLNWIERNLHACEARFYVQKCRTGGTYTWDLYMACREQILYQAMQGPILACWLADFWVTFKCWFVSQLALTLRSRSQ